MPVAQCDNAKQGKKKRRAKQKHFSLGDLNVIRKIVGRKNVWNLKFHSRATASHESMYRSTVFKRVKCCDAWQQEARGGEKKLLIKILNREIATFYHGKTWKTAVELCIERGNMQWVIRLRIYGYGYGYGYGLDLFSSSQRSLSFWMVPFVWDTFPFDAAWIFFLLT